MLIRLTYYISFNVILILCSIQVFIFCVNIWPNFEVISIWNTDRRFLNCTRDRKEFEGRVLWFGPTGRPVGVSLLSNIYQVEREGSSKLHFVRPYKVNSGYYVCKHLKDDVLIHSEQVELKVFDNIDMTGNIEQYKIEEGGELNMQCFAKFDAESVEAQLIWIYEDDQIVSNSARYKVDSTINEQSIYHKVIRSTLTINRVESSDAGLYVCQAIYANSYLSDIKSIDVEVIVQYKPQIDESPRKLVWLNEENQDGEELFLELICKAYADPPAKFQWFIGPNNLNDDSNAQNFFESSNKQHMSILTVKLKNINKFKSYIKELKQASNKVICSSTNIYGEDRLVFEFKFGTPPRTPVITYIDFHKGSKTIYMEVNYTESDPPIDTFKLVLSKTNLVNFDNSHKVNDNDKDNSFRIPYDPKIPIEYLDLYARNPVGWSRPLELQDTTVQQIPEEVHYEWKLSNWQISVLLFIVFLLVASTTVQVVYFNFCVQDEQDT